MLLGPQRVRIGEEHAGMLASIERTAAVLEKVRRAPTSFAAALCRAFADRVASVWLRLVFLLGCVHCRHRRPWRRLRLPRL